MKRIFYWDNVKGILICLVVCGHLCERYISDSDLLKHIWILIYSFHMPLFIFVNGYFARLSSKSAGKKSLKMLGYYVLMQVIFVFGNHLILGREFTISILGNPAYCCWYLLFLVYAYLIVIVWPKDVRKLKMWFAGSLILSLLAGFDVSIGHAYAMSRTFYFLPFFFLGALGAERKFKSGVSGSRDSLTAKIPYVIIAIVLFIGFWKLGDADWFNRKIFSGRWPYIELYPDHIAFSVFNRIMAYVIALVTSYVVLQLIPKRKTFFSFVGKHTLLIYLVHIFVLPMEFHLIQDVRFVGEKELNSAIILLILAVTSAIICCVLSILYRFGVLNLIKTIKEGKVFERSRK